MCVHLRGEAWRKEGREKREGVCVCVCVREREGGGGGSRGGTTCVVQLEKNNTMPVDK